MKYSVNFRNGKISIMCDAKEHIYPIGEIMCQTAKKESKAVDCLIEKENRKILRREALQYLLIYYGEGKEEYADWKNEQARKWALMIAPELVEWYLNCIKKTMCIHPSRQICFHRSCCLTCCCRYMKKQELFSVLNVRNFL